MSPEIAQKKPFGYKSDLYAVGVIAYFMALGFSEHPCQVETDYFGKKAEIPDGRCSPELKELILGLLEFDQESRWSLEKAIASEFISRVSH
eukprot:TRINITY_DN7600_c0_g1_i1.p1 TRINITY_DN7600_c0_g1~~TRINITY_DN7600_c0_g1_i1.p1  ORF type:complete len:91 (-),score=24.16 TRINITY_DN7600_c0_g1_i1:373-645(-)